MFSRSMKLAAVICFCSALLWSWLGNMTGTAHAQEDGAATATAPPAAAAEVPPPAPPPAGAGGEDAESHQRSFLSWIIESSGWIGGVILLLSIYFVALVFQQFMGLRQQNIAPPALLEECEALLKARDFQGIYRVAKADESMLGNLLTTGMAELQYGLPEAREAMDRQAEVHVVKMEKDISMMAVLGTLGPMIGLLGTLKGMIGSFSVIALSDTQLKASEVAGGISEALLLTFEGVGLSVPAIYFFAFFRNRVSTYSTDAMHMADVFIRRLNAMYRGKGQAEGQEAAE
ncbi:MotA/TolQ/ExbB proton channel family protein [Planctomicrobium sp. SH661]|uniref:MotA/TolQ/ExbB proton channel family protein n=1 Tax=Planctomicrobium sp. SH661 TaxID=3448124 RepID=UPI003F5B15A5